MRSWEDERPFDRYELAPETEEYVRRLETAVDRLTESSCECLPTGGCDMYSEPGGASAACRSCLAEHKRKAMAP